MGNLYPLTINFPAVGNLSSTFPMNYYHAFLLNYIYFLKCGSNRKKMEPEVKRKGGYGLKTKLSQITSENFFTMMVHFYPSIQRKQKSLCWANLTSFIFQ